MQGLQNTNHTAGPMITNLRIMFSVALAAETIDQIRPDYGYGEVQTAHAVVEANFLCLP